MEKDNGTIDKNGDSTRRLTPELDEWLAWYHEKMEALVAGGFTPTVETTRRGLADLTRLVTDHPAVAWIEDDRLHAPQGDIPVRIYHPDPQTALPVLIYYHGGGHMGGSVEVYDPICRKLALAAHHIVVSVDYRLAPEYPYPAGVEDACSAVHHIWETLERHPFPYRKELSIAGDSGGGALCATVAHKVQWQPEITVRRQVLIYPSLDYTLSLPSVEINGTGYLLEKEKIQWYFDHYFQSDEDRRKASPLFMAVSQRLPQTLVVTAEFCPLRDEGAAYVRKLRKEGVDAEQYHLDTMIHAFLNMEQVTPEACRAAYQTIGRFLAYR
ncbi:MAG: alpha/beta hydrolase [Desulfobacteraceae bacterium]|jgi:acetyl esterase